MPIELFFPTPVYYEFADLNTHNKIKSEYKKAEVDIVKMLKADCWGDNVKATCPTVKDLIKTYKLNNLEKFIEANVNYFLKALYTTKKKYRIVSSWANYYDKHQYQNVHIHPESKLSGVYYIQSNGNDGNLRFHPSGHAFRYDDEGNTNITHNTMAHQPQEGKLILFPSFAPHSVQPNMTDDVRISISFNIA
jgi:uncharacterized protein (TIGR02466 family)